MGGHVGHVRKVLMVVGAVLASAVAAGLIILVALVAAGVLPPETSSDEASEPLPIPTTVEPAESALGTTDGGSATSVVHLHGTDSTRGVPRLDDDGRWRTEVGGMTEVSEFAPDAVPTAAHVSAAESFVAEVKAATSRFADIEVARREGYVKLLGDPYHYVHEEFYLDGSVLDPERPEFLMYHPDTDEFLGVMFLMPAGVRGPQFGGPLTTWHVHDGGASEGICWDGSVELPERADPRSGQCPRGELRADTPEMLHVWVVDDASDPYATHIIRP